MRTRHTQHQKYPPVAARAARFSAQPLLFNNISPCSADITDRLLRATPLGTSLGGPYNQSVSSYTFCSAHYSKPLRGWHNPKSVRISSGYCQIWIAYRELHVDAAMAMANLRLCKAYKDFRTAPLIQHPKSHRQFSISSFSYGQLFFCDFLCGFLLLSLIPCLPFRHLSTYFYRLNSTYIQIHSYAVGLEPTVRQA